MTHRGKIAIVSSYNEECGAAFYSSRLLKHLQAAGYQVDVKRLPISLLRVWTPTQVRKKGDEEIRRIAEEIREYDGVLLQFEPGLYGTTAKSSYTRVKTLLKAAKRAVLTVHGFDRSFGRLSLGRVAANISRGKLGDLYHDYRNSSIFSHVNDFWAYVKNAKHIQTMTFCKGDQTLLQRYYDLKNITNYPITYFDRNEVNSYRNSVDRADTLKKYGLDPNKKYFAVCGFLNAYKGHLTAMKALEFLPPEWELAIIGGEHPHGVEAERDIGNYVRQLLAFSLESEQHNDGELALASAGSNAPPPASWFPQLNSARQDLRSEMFAKSEFKYFLPKKELANRIKFLGQVSDEEMPKLYVALDYFVHPYIKTRSGQSGSGPATMALEFGARSLFSNAPVFREMNQYFPGAMTFFNIGNFIELAESLQRYDANQGDVVRNLEEALNSYNPEGMVRAYGECLGF